MTDKSDEHLENASFLIQVVPGLGNASIYLCFLSLSSYSGTNKNLNINLRISGSYLQSSLSSESIVVIVIF